MKNMLAMAQNLIVKKVGLWLVGLLGLSGIGIVFLVMIILLLLVGIVGGSSSSSANSSPTVGSYCAATGEISNANWDKVFSNAGKLSDAKDDIISISKEQGIDPVLFAAISLHETGYGKAPAIVNKNNPGGLMGSGGVIVFPTLRDGLEAMGRTLHNRIIVDGLNTIEKLGNVYAPVGAANDPNHLNDNWVPTVTKMVESLGGLTMNCEASEGEMAGEMPDIKFDGNTSELRKNLIKTAMTKIGKEYVWGGGRTPESIARDEFDCSSFVNWVFRENGIHLAGMGANTDVLKHVGKRISFKDIKVGDVIFYNTYKQDGHIVIYMGNGKFIGQNGEPGNGWVGIKNHFDSDWQSVFTGHVRRYIND